MKTSTGTAFIVFAGIFLSVSCKHAATVQPERKDITQAVYASGKVMPLRHYIVFPKSPGYVEKIHVRAGDTVLVGELLITLRNDVNEYSISSSENTTALARKNADEKGPLLTALRQELEATHSRYELDSINFRRNNTLLEEEAISRIAFDQSRTQLDLSRSAYFRSRESYDASRDRYRTEYLNSVNQTEAQRSNRKDYELLSAINGKVYDVLPEVGDLVSLQSPLLELGDADRFEVELSIDETDIALLHVGQQVIYGIDAYPEQAFKGIITEIIPKVTANSKSSRVKATIEAPGSLTLYCGMTVEANIVVQSKKNALVVPREFVRNGNQVQVEGEERPRRIRKGLEDLEYIEILEGITGTETLTK